MFNTFSILTVVILSVQIAFSQVVEFKPSLLSFRNTKLSLGLGTELSGTGFVTFNGKPVYAIVRFNNPADSGKAYLNHFSIDFDLYSPNSILGFWSAIAITNNEFYIKGSNKAIDYFDVHKIELPVYLKFRTGGKNKNMHFWIAIGGSFNYNISVKRKYLLNNQFAFAEDKSKEQLLNNALSAGGLIGYELVNSEYNDPKTGEIYLSKFRLLLYMRFNYFFNNILNNEYSEFIYNSNRSAISEYQNIELKYLALSLGVKLLFKF